MVQTVGFIGSGAIGGALAKLSVAAGFNVIVSNSRGPATLSVLVEELGLLARAATPEQAARESDLVVASVPFKFYDQLPAVALAGKIVIDTMNYRHRRDGVMDDIEAREMTSSAFVQRHLSRSKVVKGLHNLEFRRLLVSVRNSGSKDRRALPIAGDDASAKGEVVRYMDRIGYDAVDVGMLADSWRCEPGTPIYVLPYTGEAPEGLTTEEAKQWFLDTPGVAISSDQAKSLLAQAERGVFGPSYLELPAGMRDVMQDIRDGKMS